jgi:DNA-directed RNA polymerase specialized sigma24 family protein
LWAREALLYDEMDKEAFEKFYATNFKRAVNILRKMGVIDAEDIAQNTFLYLWEHPDKWSDGAYFWRTLRQRGNSELKRQQVLEKKMKRE